MVLRVLTPSFLAVKQINSYLGSILSYIIISIPILAGNYDTTDPSKISEIISKVRINSSRYVMPLEDTY
jgi:hypothetical protein